MTASKNLAARTLAASRRGCRDGLRASRYADSAMPRRLLAVDTATEACSVALWLDGKTIERYEVAGRDHTRRLLPMVHALMNEAGIAFRDLDGLVCGVGPGSFVGVRIAVGFVKGLGLALERPVVGVSELAMLSQAAIERGAPGAIACIDARMDEVYLGVYRADASGLASAASAERVLAPREVRLDPALAPGFAAVGSGWRAYRDTLATALGWEPAPIEPERFPRAGDALRLAQPRFVAGETESPDSLSPIYLRDRVALTLSEQAIARGADRR